MGKDGILSFPDAVLLRCNAARIEQSEFDPVGRVGNRACRLPPLFDTHSSCDVNRVYESKRMITIVCLSPAEMLTVAVRPSLVNVSWYVSPY